MSKKVLTLLKGELVRLNKYHVTAISLLLAFVWFVLLYFIEDNGVLSEFLPMIIIVDTTMMSIMYIGSVLFFEKTESTISTMLVTPVKYQDHIVAKVLAITIETLLSTLLIVLVFFFIRNITINWGVLIVALILPTLLSSLVGFAISYHTKDFTSLLSWLMGYVFLTFVPVILSYLDIVFKADAWQYIFLILPVGSALEITSVAMGAAITVKFWIAVGVMSIVTVLLNYLYVLPKFKDYAVRQSGV